MDALANLPIQTSRVSHSPLIHRLSKKGSLLPFNPQLPTPKIITNSPSPNNLSFHSAALISAGDTSRVVSISSAQWTVRINVTHPQANNDIESAERRLGFDSRPCAPDAERQSRIGLQQEVGNRRASTVLVQTSTPSIL